MDVSDNNNTIIKIYNFNTMQLISTIVAGYNSSTVLKFTPDEKYIVLAQGVSNNNLSIWDVQTGRMLRQRLGGTYETLDISNENDGSYMSSSTSRTLGVFKFPVLSVSNPIETSKDVLYPNPSTGFLIINVNLPITSILKADLSDMNGNTISNVYKQFTEQGGNKIQFDLSRFPSGTYFLSLNSSNFSRKYKVILNK